MTRSASTSNIGVSNNSCSENSDFGTSSLSSFQGSGYASGAILSPGPLKNQRRSIMSKGKSTRQANAKNGSGGSFMEGLKIFSPKARKEEREANKKLSNMFDF